MFTAHLTFTCSKSKTETLDKRYEIYSKLIIRTSERRQWRRHWQHISPFFNVSIIDFEQVNVSGRGHGTLV